MPAYYSEFDPYAAQWLRNLIAAGHIAPGDVDERDIREVQPDDLRGYDQCHFFAGIGGWSYALRLAGWPDDRPVFTGSPPCQPFSAAGKRTGTDDPRHLWPEFYRLIRECRPVVTIGEQVASAIGHGWLDGVLADLEEEGYAVGAVVLGAHSVGAPHIRQRLWFVAERLDNAASQRTGFAAGRQPDGDYVAASDGANGRVANTDCPELRGQPPAGHEPPDREDEGIGGLAKPPREQVGDAGQSRQSAGAAGGVDDTPGPRHEPTRRGQPEQPERRECLSGVGCEDGRLGDADPARPQGWRERSDEHTDQRSPWSAGQFIPCADGKARRVESGIFPLVDGLPDALDGLGPVRRVGVLKGAGNAIVPQRAAEFIRAWLDVRDAA